MAFYDFISFFELKLSWDISTHDPGSCLDLFHSGKKGRIAQVHSRKDPWIFWTFSNFLDGLSQEEAALPRLLLVVVVVKFYGSIEFCYCKLVEVSVVSCVHVACSCTHFHAEEICCHFQPPGWNSNRVGITSHFLRMQVSKVFKKMHIYNNKM